jgi:hypothetical protein
MHKLAVTVSCLFLLGCIQPHEFKHAGKDTGLKDTTEVASDVAASDGAVDIAAADLPDVTDTSVSDQSDVTSDGAGDSGGADGSTADQWDVAEDQWDVQVDVCTPACDGKLCGPDGCGAQCGSCAPGDDPCMENSCNEDSGQCEEHPVPNEDQVECADGNPCTDVGVCFDGECQSDWLPTPDLAFADCLCNLDSQCKLFETPFPCDGVFFCNFELEPPRCDVDLQQALDCDDSLLCTEDTCHPDDGCIHTPMAQLSTEEVTCCIESDAECDTGDPCLAGVCFMETQQCEAIALGPETDCPDDTACNGDEYCQSGLCQPGTPPVCDDLNDCTDDQCDPAVGCVFVNNNGNFCSDYNACNGEEWCLDGECQDGDPPVCDDENDCTDDSCDPDSGCVFTPNSAPCDDGQTCTVSDQCLDTQCTGDPIDCNDGDPCTDALCEQDTGCLYGPVTGESCDDGDFCTVSDTCFLGLCKGSTNSECEEGDFDHDGLPGSQDLCPTAFDAGNLNLNGDGHADACEPLAGDFAFGMPLTLTENGQTPSARRTHEPVEIPLRNGIVDASVLGYWRFDQTPIDASFSSHEVQLSELVSYQPSMDDLFDHALEFNGFATATVEHDDWMDHTGTFSVMLWVAPTSLSGKQVLMARYQKKPLLDAVFALRLYQGQFSFDLWDDSGTQHTLASLTTADAGWQHLGASYDGRHMTLYVNGVMDSRLDIGSVSLTTNTVGLSFGNTFDQGLDEPYKGQLDEALWFSRALSPDEIEVYVRSAHPYGSHLLPGAQADFDDARVVESGDTGEPFAKRLRILGPRPHSDTPCPTMYSETPMEEIPAIADRDDLCGVVSWWKLDSDGQDAMGVNHGQVTGATPVPGRFGAGAASLQFGQDTNIVIDHQETLNLPDLTLEAWVHLDSEDLGDGVRFIASNAQDCGYVLGLKAGQFYAAVVATGSGYVEVSHLASLDAVGAWTHVGLSIGDGTLRLYLNGLLVNETTFTGIVDYSGPFSHCNYPLFLGDDGVFHDPSGNYNFHGQIDEVVFHSVVKSPDYMFHRAQPGVPKARFLARTTINEVPDQGFPFVDYTLHWGASGATAIMPFGGDGDGEVCYGLLNNCMGYAGWWRLNEGSGNVAVDWSTGKSNGTYTANAMWGPGAEGLAFKGDGQVRYVLIEDEPRFHVEQGTWEALFTPAADWQGPLEEHQFILAKHISGSAKDYGLSVAYQTGKVRFAVEPPGGVDQYLVFSDSDSWFMGQTYQVAVRVGPEATTLHVDYTPQQDESDYDAGLAGQGAELTLGAFPDYSAYFNGLLDGFRFMSRALTVDEMLHYPLASYSWDMDEELFSDGDGDGVADDGDFSGVAGDNPCIGGQVTYCDDSAPDLDNPDQADGDGDGASDLLDNCPDHFNPLQEDDNGNGVGSVCDVTEMDWDHDGLLPAEDDCPYAFDPGNLDRNQNFQPDACEALPPDHKHLQTIQLSVNGSPPSSRRTHEVVEIPLRPNLDGTETFVPGAQADLDDVRVTETPHTTADPEQTGERVVPSRVIGPRPHSDTLCPLETDDGTWADREDLCGVVAYWAMDGNGQDVTGDHHAAVTVATPKVGRFGRPDAAMEFGANKHLIVPFSPDFVLQQLTLEAWVRLEDQDPPSGSHKIASNTDGGGYAMYVKDGTASFSIYPMTTEDFLAVEYALPPDVVGQWIHLAASYDGQTLRLYVDGVERSSLFIGAPMKYIGNEVLSIGDEAYQGLPQGTSNLHGAMDELILHKVAKSPDYIYHRANPGVPTVRFMASTSVNKVNGVGYPYRDYKLYAGDPDIKAEMPFVGRADGTICFGLLNDCTGYAGWWRFDEGAGTIAQDSSTWKQTGQLLPEYSPPTWVPGISGWGLELDGATHYVDLGPMEHMTGHIGRTVEVAVQGTDGTLQQDGCYGNKLLDKTGPEGDFYLASEPEANLYFIGADMDQTEPGGTLGTSDALDGFWHSVAVVLGLAQPSAPGILYLDTQYVTEGEPENVDSGVNLYLGSSSSQFEMHQCHFDGAVDSVRIMNRALSPDELLHFPEGTPTLTCIPHCEGKQCGDDGCGGSCGTCADLYACDGAGQCVVAACPPLCESEDVDHDGLAGEDDLCPYAWDPDNLDYDDDGWPDACEPVTTVMDLPLSRPVYLIVDGTDSMQRRTHQPMRIPLVNGFLDDSVLGCWRLDGNGDDATGQRNGTTTDVTPVPGAFMDAGGALDFSLPSAHVKITDNDSALSGLSVFTLMAWFKPPPSPGNFEVIVGKGNNTDGLPTDSYYLALKKLGPEELVVSGHIHGTSLNVQVDGDLAIAEESWHHAALSFVGGRVNLFLDGKLAKSMTWGGEMAVTVGIPLIIGAHAGGEAFTGDVDEVVLFSRTVSPEEIANYVASSAPYAAELVPGAQDDFDDVRITELGDNGVEAVKRTRIIGPRPHSDTPCPYADPAQAPALAHRDDLCAVEGYWRLGDSNEDLSGNGHTAASIGSPTLVPGRFGKEDQATWFEDLNPNVGTYLDFAIPQEMVWETTGVTVEAWVNVPPGMMSDYGTILGMLEGNDGGDWFSFNVGPDGKLMFGWEVENTPYVLVNSDSRVDDEQWHHVAAVMKDKNLTLYVDGLPDGFGSSSKYKHQLYTTVGGGLRCGWAKSILPHQLVGKVDELLVHTTAKSADYIYRRARPGIPMKQFFAATSIEPDQGGLYPAREYTLRWGDSDATMMQPLAGDGDGQESTGDCYGLLNGCTGYVGWWRFNEGVLSSRVGDESANHLDGVFKGSHYWFATAEGLGRYFDGDFNWAEIPYDPVMNVDNFTLETFARIDQPEGNQTIIARDDANNSQSYYLGLASDQGLYVTYADEDGTTEGIMNGPPMQAGDWKHMVGTYDGADLTAYVGDVATSDQPDVGPGDTTMPLLFGASMTPDPPTKYHFKGVLDFVRVMSRALQPDEFIHTPPFGWLLGEVE